MIEHGDNWELVWENGSESLWRFRVLRGWLYESFSIIGDADEGTLTTHSSIAFVPNPPLRLSGV